jgi:hypothetical protein
MKRYTETNLPEEGLRAKVTVLRDDPPPGQEAQIDYGYLGSWIDPIGGRRRQLVMAVPIHAEEDQPAGLKLLRTAATCRPGRRSA